MKATIPHGSSEEIDMRMLHPSEGDFPESLATLANIAHQQNWKVFSSYCE